VGRDQKVARDVIEEGITPLEVGNRVRINPAAREQEVIRRYGGKAVCIDLFKQRASSHERHVQLVPPGV